MTNKRMLISYMPILLDSHRHYRRRLQQWIGSFSRSSYIYLENVFPVKLETRCYKHYVERYLMILNYIVQVVHKKCRPMDGGKALALIFSDPCNDQ